MEQYQTDREIKDEAIELLKECQQVSTLLPTDATEQGLWGRTLFLYLKDKVLDHSPKYYRKKHNRHIHENEGGSKNG